MLALDDLLNMVGDPFTALTQPCERFGTRRARRGVAFEQLKEVALLGKQALEPGEHTAYPRFLGYIIDNAGRPRDGAKALVAERTDQRLKIGLVDRAGGFGKGEPAPFALVLFLPLPEFAGHRERKHLDVEHDQIGRAHVELQSLMRISYAVFCLKKKK